MDYPLYLFDNSKTDYVWGDVVVDDKKRYSCFLQDWCNIHPGHDPKQGTQAWKQLKSDEVLAILPDTYVLDKNDKINDEVLIHQYWYRCKVSSWCSLAYYSPVGYNGHHAWENERKDDTVGTCYTGSGGTTDSGSGGTTDSGSGGTTDSGSVPDNGMFQNH